MSGLFEAPEWSHDTNIYEVNLRQYTREGSFNAFAAHLPRLRDMGVEVLWFMPITPISVAKRLGTLGSYYACADYITTNPEYGSLQDFRRLVETAHQMGFKVLIDWVANHTGWDHRWTRENPEFYKRNASGEFYDANGWEDVIDLDYSHAGLRQAMIDAMRFWVETADIDGFRCDMAMLVPLDFWQEARTTLDRVKKLFWLAECEEPDYYKIFDAGYGWKLLHRMEAYWRKETGIAGLQEVLAYYDENISPSAYQALFTSNHDENSHSGSEYERMGDAAKAFAVLCCTWDGIPLIYSGQELPNYKRLRFFDKDQIDWTDPCALHGFYHSLLSLRKNNRALRARDPLVNRFWIKASQDNQVLAFMRDCPETQVVVILNLSPDTNTCNLQDDKLAGDFRECFTGESIRADKGLVLSMSAWQYKLYERRKDHSK